MGTGKTTLGRLLAKRIGYKFIDTDAVIENRSGQTIAELFQQQGEMAFRQLESKLVTELAQQQQLVIATGGGLVLDPKNVTKLSATGQIICLTAQTKEILTRIASQPTVRPLLQEGDPLAKVEELLEQRASVYKQFPQLSTTNMQINSLVERLIEMWIEHP